MAIKREIWHPARYTKKQHRAVQLVGLHAEGKADRPPTSEEMKTAMDWIIYEAASYTDNGFVSLDQHGRVGAFVDGRQSVAQQVIKLFKLKVQPEKETGEADEQ